MSTLVMKFGGTSVGSTTALKQSAAIVLDHSKKWENMVVVVSAMSGVTDALVASSKAAMQGNEKAYLSTIEIIRQKHKEVIEDLMPSDADRTSLMKIVDGYIEQLTAFCKSIHIMGEVTNRGLDAITSFGERMNARVFAALLCEMGMQSQAVDAMDLIVTDRTFQNAAPLRDKTRTQTQAVLLPLFQKKIIPVVTGFIGATEDGIITTLGRGGSDYTAAILGDSLDADEVFTWTDVDGVMTADPRIVPDALVIPELSYIEVGEMAYFGAKVLHPKTILPCVERDIPLWVKNTFNPSHPGTRISRTPKTVPGKITSITRICDLSMITVEGRGMLGVPGIAARTFAAVARQGASILMISQSSSEQSICFVIPTKSAPQVVRSIEEEIALELMRGDLDKVWAMDDVVIVTVIGSGMRYTPGVSARVFGALGAENINVVAIAQGSSEYSISLVIGKQDADNAVRCIHREVVVNGKK